MSDLLQQIQSLQFDQREYAERLLQDFISDTFNLDVISVELRPLAVSLNSFNGFLKLTDGKQFFFKSHTEADTIISEYYNADHLASVGYPVVQPVMNSTETGKQILIYEVVSDPSVFDVARSIEQGNNQYEAVLTKAQHTADDLLDEIYTRTGKQQSALDAKQAPIHQLFYHRLTGGRLQRFYHPQNNICLPDKFSFETVLHKQWEINGQTYSESLNDLIVKAIQVLHPQQAGINIIGHGDAHNGNVFLHFNGSQAELIYFDPAFAGRHNPLLDLAKPLFHNVFAMWMYFPEIEAKHLKISLTQTRDQWKVEYDYPLHAIRLMFLESKLNRVLLPLLQRLQRQNNLPDNWRSVLKAALFCCPFLTMNLADNIKFPAEISLLGLAISIEMGGESLNIRSLIDQKLDEIEFALR